MIIKISQLQKKPFPNNDYQNKPSPKKPLPIKPTPKINQGSKGNGMISMEEIEKWLAEELKLLQVNDPKANELKKLEKFIKKESTLDAEILRFIQEICITKEILFNFISKKKKKKKATDISCNEKRKQNWRWCSWTNF